MATRKPTGNGPGRGTPRSRTVSRPGERAARPARRVTAEKPQQPAGFSSPGAPAPRLARSIGLTRRALAVFVVAMVLVLSYASSLRVYMRQSDQEAQARQQMAQRDAAIATLQDEVERWKDPNYVRAQARDRLGWVMPGEVGFRVIGPDGKPLGGGTTIQGTSALPAGEHETTWYERLDGSVAAADAPIPVGPPSAPPAITASSPASPSPTPGASSTPTPTATQSAR